MHVETAVLRIVEDSRWDEEAEGYGDDDMYGGGWSPAGEGIDHMGGQVELFGSYVCDGYCNVSIDVVL